VADTEGNRRDLRLRDGRWTGRVDVLAGCPNGGDVDLFLHTQGWESFLILGDSDDAEVSLRSWQRGRDDDTDEYLLQVASGTSDELSPYLLFDSLPELLDAFSRWAPLVQAAAVTGAMAQLRGGLQDDGLVETIAARVVYGVEYAAPALRREKRKPGR
jgi:hypothetical protein